MMNPTSQIETREISDSELDNVSGGYTAPSATTGSPLIPTIPAIPAEPAIPLQPTIHAIPASPAS
jgi:hypothetical protein